MVLILLFLHVKNIFIFNICVIKYQNQNLSNACLILDFLYSNNYKISTELLDVCKFFYKITFYTIEVYLVVKKFCN